MHVALHYNKVWLLPNLKTIVLNNSCVSVSILCVEIPSNTCFTYTGEETSGEEDACFQIAPFVD